ncbi:hypothetical protein D9M71_451460 [compost metagenome]
MLQAARHGRNGNRPCGTVEDNLRRIGMEVQRDIQLPGEQVAATRLRPQSMLDEATDQHADAGLVIRCLLPRREHLPMHRPEPLRVDHRIDQHREDLLLRVVIQPYRRNLAEVDAHELYRRADGQAAHRLVETQAQVMLLPGRRGQCGVTVGEQLEHLLFDRRSARPGTFGGAEGEAADQDGRQRFGVDLDAIGADIEVDAAGVPEARVLGDEGVVGRLDEDADIHALAIAAQRIGHHFAYGNLAVVDRRADIQRAQVISLQDETLALFAIGDRRRRLQAGEASGRDLRLAGIGTDEIA